MDAVLVARAQSGDVEALNELMRAVRDLAFRYASRRLRTFAGGRQNAEDVAQEATIAVLLALPRYQPGASGFSAFVQTVTTRKIVDVHRRFARAGEFSSDSLPEKTSVETGPEHTALVRQDLDEALRALAELPPKMALALRLRGEGLDAAEVGAVMGMKPGAVRVLQHRGLSQMRVLRG